MPKDRMVNKSLCFQRAGSPGRGRPISDVQKIIKGAWVMGSLDKMPTMTMKA